MKPAMLLGKQNTLKICKVGVEKCFRQLEVFKLVFSILFILVLPMNQALAEDAQSETITEEMVASYLDQALKSQTKGIVRFEKGYLETALNRSLDRYKELHGKTEYLKAGLSVAKVSPELKEKLFEHFKSNLARYRKLTGLKIRYIPQGSNERNVYFDMAVAGMPVYQMSTSSAYVNRLYHGKKGEKLQQAIEREKQRNSIYKTSLFIRRENRSVNMAIGLLDSTHPLIEKKGVNSVLGNMNQMFFNMFTDTINVRDLPSILVVPNYKYGDIQPLDVAYLKALYSNEIHSGMPLEQAKPILKKHMISYLGIS
ncbi:hypothetical protein [Hydrogenovibrio sp. JE_KL2]|uniref:hypothetical protein n=1 Tax=Hydrogenovibrio sp. JE_KL2 TaxID=2651188 RepID=UPI00128B87DF|nr:hypothetical protein [Hydrogenovibrio sp. JE_KL2]MPQ76480.1 hypothetical protein [Hydrogenovibrio sp. JE_KL2]